MNAKNTPSDSNNRSFIVTLKATYRYPYMGGLVGTDFSRTVVDTFSTSSRDEILGLIKASFEDIMERMYRASDDYDEKPNWVEDESIGIPVWAMNYQRRAKKRVLDATWDNIHDGFSAKVFFNRGNAPYEFSPQGSEVAGVPTSLEISVSSKEDEYLDGGKDETENEEQRLDILSPQDFITHCAKSNDDVTRSDMFDYIDDLKNGLDIGLDTPLNSGPKNETKAI